MISKQRLLTHLNRLEDNKETFWAQQQQEKRQTTNGILSESLCVNIMFVAEIAAANDLK